MSLNPDFPSTLYSLEPDLYTKLQLPIPASLLCWSQSLKRQFISFRYPHVGLLLHSISYASQCVFCSAMLLQLPLCVNPCSRCCSCTVGHYVLHTLFSTNMMQLPQLSHVLLVVGTEHCGSLFPLSSQPQAWFWSSRSSASTADLGWTWLLKASCNNVKCKKKSNGWNWRNENMKSGLISSYVTVLAVASFSRLFFSIFTSWS